MSSYYISPVMLVLINLFNCINSIQTTRILLLIYTKTCIYIWIQKSKTHIGCVKLIMVNCKTCLFTLYFRYVHIIIINYIFKIYKIQAWIWTRKFNLKKKKRERNKMATSITWLNNNIHKKRQEKHSEL